MRKNTLRLSGMIAVICLSLACFTYINSIRIDSPVVSETIYADEMENEENGVMPDVELIKRIVRKAFEFMSLTNL